MHAPMPLKIENISKLIENEQTEVLEKCIKRREMNAILHKQGGNAEIYISKDRDYKNVCLKKIKERPQILHNDVDNEHKFQIKARQAGVRTPMPLFSIETKDGGKYILMEFIQGETVADVIARPTLLPKNFNYNLFCQTLDSYVEKMHTAGLYHRDLHSKNVMIEKKTGLPVIIDFGTATEGSGSDLTYEESVSLLNPSTNTYEQKNGFFKDDNIMARNLKATLRQLGQKMRVLTSQF